MTNTDSQSPAPTRWPRPVPAAPLPGPDAEWRRTRFRHATITSTLAHVVCAVFAGVLLARIVLVIGDANPDNGVAAFVRVWSHAVSLGFEDLFTPASAGWRALVNYGLAALAWLGLGALASTLIYRFVEPRRDEPTTG